MTRSWFGFASSRRRDADEDEGDAHGHVLHRGEEESDHHREGFDGGPVCTSRNTLGEERVSMATPAKPALGAQI